MEEHFEYFKQMRLRLLASAQITIRYCWLKYKKKGLKKNKKIFKNAMKNPTSKLSIQNKSSPKNSSRLKKHKEPGFATTKNK
jgi:hypothetical protein